MHHFLYLFFLSYFHILFSLFFFFFNDTATTEIYTLSLHDALPICYEVPAGRNAQWFFWIFRVPAHNRIGNPADLGFLARRSEEHTSELQSQSNLVCRLLLEKKKKKKIDRR